MKNNRRNHRAGFTLAELLMTIAILAVLFGIGFVNVIRYQRQLKLTENNDIAREIFTAAQNRMTSDKANGIWDVSKAPETGEMKEPADFGTNYPTLDKDGKGAVWPDPNNEYVYVLYDASSSSSIPSFLPLGSIDESVRTDGHYIIEYNKKNATVYGVWYSDAEISYGDVSALDKTRSNDSDAKKTRLEYKAGNKRRIIGYYGNAVAANIDPVDISLKPNLEIHNDDILFASISFVNDPEKKNEVSEIKLTVDGLKSKATVTKTVYKNSGSIDSKDSYAAGLVYSNDHGSNVVRNVVLDDITSDNGHFANIFNKVLKSENTNSFIPGEDIRITAKFTVNGKEVKRTAATNSLFAQISDVKGNAVKKNAAIANTRHLENLSKAFSSVNADSTDTSAFIVSSAEVIKDISFNGNEIGADGSPSAFISRIAYLRSAYLTAKTEVSITTVSGVSQTPGRFYAISSQYLDTFEGNMHRLSDFDISASNNDSLNTDKDAGLFANAGSTDLEKSSGYIDIKDLLLENFSVEGSRNVGTLIGTAGNGTIENVAVYATSEAEYRGGSWNLESTNWSKRDINYNTGVWSTGGGGTAGGFIGSVDLKSGDSGLSVSNSFAAVPVRSSCDNSIAGGLVGSINTNSKTVNIKNSYAGGFAEKSATDQGKANYSLHSINIISGSQDNGITGGLIGEVSGTNLRLENVYSTASAAGHISGGLIGLNK